MGRRKGKAKKVAKKKKYVVATTFKCIFCATNESVSCKLNFNTNVGSLECHVCQEKFESNINNLTDPIDVFSEWLDATTEAHEDKAKSLLPRSASVKHTPSSSSSSSSSSMHRPRNSDDERESADPSAADADTAANDYDDDDDDDNTDRRRVKKSRPSESSAEEDNGDEEGDQQGSGDVDRGVVEGEGEDARIDEVWRDAPSLTDD